MRDDTKEQLDMVSDRINKAKTSLGHMENLHAAKTLETEFVDLLPLGQFPGNEEGQTDKEKQPSPF